MKRWLPALILSLLSMPVFAYGPIAVDTHGTPLVHPNLDATHPLIWNPETGPLQDTSTKHTFTTPTVTTTADQNSAYLQLLTFCGLSSAGGRSLVESENSVIAE